MNTATALFGVKVKIEGMVHFARRDPKGHVVWSVIARNASLFTYSEVEAMTQRYPNLEAICVGTMHNYERMTG